VGVGLGLDCDYLEVDGGSVQVILDVVGEVLGFSLQFD
jgi:hypothetical protein